MSPNPPENFQLEEAMWKNQFIASRMSNLSEDVIINVFICWMILSLCKWIMYTKDKKKE